MAKRTLDFGKIAQRTAGATIGAIAGKMINEQLEKNQSMSPMIKGLILIGAGGMAPDFIDPQGKMEIVQSAAIPVMQYGVKHLFTAFNMESMIGAIGMGGQAPFVANPYSYDEIPAVADAFEDEDFDFKTTEEMEEELEHAY